MGLNSIVTDSEISKADEQVILTEQVELAELGKLCPSGKPRLATP